MGISFDSPNRLPYSGCLKSIHSNHCVSVNHILVILVSFLPLQSFSLNHIESVSVHCGGRLGGLHLGG